MPDPSAGSRAELRITTERLLLVPFTRSDADEHYDALVSAPQVARWLPGSQPGSHADATALTAALAAHWDQYGYRVFAVRDRTTGRFWSVPDFIDTDLGCQVGRVSES